LDMSEGGARLALGSAFENSPHKFTLILFKDASVQRDCELLWTDRRCVAVKFLSGWYGRQNTA
jgi:hypothetical protein